jgi:PAS domain S-box-containing protein
LAEQDLEQLLTLLGGPAYVLCVEEDGRVQGQWIGPELARLTGYTAEELRALGGPRTIAHPEDVALATEYIETLLAGREARVEYRLIAKGGAVRWVSEQGRPALDPSGRRVSRIYAVLEDISGRREAEANRRNEQRYRFLFEHTQDLPYATGPDGELTYLGPQFERYGHDPHEVMERGVLSVIHPDDIPRVTADLARTFGDGEEFPTEFRIVTPDGESVWLEDRGRLVRDDDGRILGLFGVLRDITAKKRAAEALRRSEERLRRLAEQSMDTIVELDHEGCITFISPAIERITGRKPEDIVGGPMYAHMPPESEAAAVDTFRRILEGETLEGVELSAFHEDGRLVCLEVNACPLVASDEVVGVQAVVRDITTRKAIEAEIRQLHKMEALGHLAGGVAHDFNNLLTGILGHASLLAERELDPAEVKLAAQTIETAATRARELTRQLLSFARENERENEPVDLHEIVDEVVTLLGRTVNRRIELTTELSSQHALVMGDAGQLEQVLLNLAVNACDAMPEGGRLSIQSEDVTLDEEAVRTQPDLRPGHYLRLVVQDTGPGVPRDLRNRIFEPFFTTKDRGEGTGMGLAAVYSIVRSHHGGVHVSGRSGSGATFTVLLPSAEPGSETAAEPTDHTAPTGRGRLLLVDDEPVVRTTVEKLLSMIGYKVTTAGGGPQAIELFTRAPNAYDLVILDISMPAMSGPACFQALRDIDPRIRVLVATGHGLDGAAQSLLDKGAAGFIQKPFRLAELSQAVREALDQTSPTSKGK